MSITIETVGEPSTWNRYVERAPQAGVFHRHEALAVQADYAGATVHRFVGYADGQPVGLFPVFEKRYGFVTTVFSPPPSLRVPYLGPALLDGAEFAANRSESRGSEFVTGVLNHVCETFDPSYEHFRTDYRYTDTRPLTRREFQCRVNHTYVVDLSVGRETLLSSFSSDARSNVRGTADDAYEIAVGGAEAVRDIVQQVETRYESQEIRYSVPVEFVVDLYERLPDGFLKPYVLRADGESVGGILVLDDGVRASRWQGGVRADESDVPANDLLDWRVMTDASEGGVSEYDFVGADNERISRYKSKFAPELRTFCSLWRGSLVTSQLVRGYRKFA